MGVIGRKRKAKTAVAVAIISACAIGSVLLDDDWLSSSSHDAGFAAEEGPNRNWAPNNNTPGPGGDGYGYSYGGDVGGDDYRSLLRHGRALAAADADADAPSQNNDEGEGEEGEEDEGVNYDDANVAHSWSRTHLLEISVPPSVPSSDNFLFWHISKSGGSNTKAIYRCMGKKIDVKSGWLDILNAKRSGLVASGKVDVIFTSFPSFAAENLYDALGDGENDDPRSLGDGGPARAMALFRHPVDRLVSKFAYLQIATWERTYSPQWKDMDILTWAEKANSDNNQMVRSLARKARHATESDLRAAKATIRQKFVVGLVDEMEESVRRFNAVMGIDDESSRKCTKRFFGVGKEGRMRRTNSNPHPTVERDSPAWRVIAEKNALDIRLYEYVVRLFEEQREIVDSYPSSSAVPIGVSEVSR